MILDRKFGSPTITKDGVTVAKEIDLKDALENMGAEMVKEVASKTSDVAGDGTTTATVLAQAIYREGAKNVTAGASPMAVKRGIDKAVAAMTTELQRMSKPVTGPMIAQVGTISANHDETIGRLIAEAMEKVGKDGVITVEEARSMDTSLDVVAYTICFAIRLSRFLSACFDDRQHFVLAHDEVLLTINFDVLTRILAEQDHIARLDIERDAHAALFERAAAGGDHRASLRLLLGGVRDNDSAALLPTFFVATDDDSIVERSDIHKVHPHSKSRSCTRVRAILRPTTTVARIVRLVFRWPRSRRERRSGLARKSRRASVNVAAKAALGRLRRPGGQWRTSWPATHRSTAASPNVTAMSQQRPFEDRPADCLGSPSVTRCLRGRDGPTRRTRRLSPTAGRPSAARI